MLDEKQKGALDMGCGGDADVEIRYIDASDPGDFVDEFRLADTAYIFGGGHVAYALEPVLRHVDFKTVVIDDREEYANKERFPKAERTIAEPDFDHAFDHIETDEDSYIIIVTRGHRGDLQVHSRALRGMIGSRRKNRLLYDELLKEGVSQELIDRVHAPIGLDIGSETPEEIAISIVAEIIKEESRKKTDRRYQMKKKSSPPLGALILAAGMSSRMGAFKPLLKVGEETALLRIINRIKAAGIEDIVLVTGYERQRLLPLIEGKGIKEVYNESYRQGMFESVKAGLEACAEIFAEDTAFFSASRRLSPW